MKVSLLYLPSVGDRARIERGRAGLDMGLYGQMLAELSEQAKLADALGYDSISFTEHHFHAEGLEYSNNPVMLDLFVGMQTRQIRVGQLGIVLPTHNPIRVAEDIAMLDHMTGGRANAGFARGYQRRWVDVMAQQMHGIHGAMPHQHDAIDEANRLAFEECFEIVKRAWTQDWLAYAGRYWRIPAGETPWPIEATARFGGGVRDGVVREVAVVPKPLQKPHPPLFQPFASSERSVRWCAEQGVTAVLPALLPARERALFELYAEASGRPLGDGVGVLRDVVIADSDAEAQALWRESSGFLAEHWLRAFGFGSSLVDPQTRRPPDLLNHGLALVGTVDTVTRQLETLLERLPVQRIFALSYIQLVPHAALMSSIEKFWTKVLPRVL